jgi:Na+/proline symporter
MHAIDWLIIGGLLALMVYAALSTRKYNRSVADFLAASRCARKYMLGVAEGLSCVGAITIVAWFELYYRGGFASAWWQLVTLLIQVIVAMSGWVAYRYRQTRGLTLAQILEMRYSRGFRLFTGFVIFISGTLNFGIFPAVAGRFFQYYWGLQPCLVNIGFASVDVVYAGIMLALTCVALLFIFAGGQITIMLTDFIQGTFANICLVAIVIYLLILVPWTDIESTLLRRDRAEIGPIAPLAVHEAYAEAYTATPFRLANQVRMIFADSEDLPAGIMTTRLAAAASSPADERILEPDTILYRVPAEQLAMVAETAYDLTFAYRTDDANQYHLIVAADDGRVQSQNRILPGTGGKDRMVSVEVTAASIGRSGLIFAKHGDRPGEFSLSPVSLRLVSGQSLFQPFKSGATKDFNMWYFLIQAIIIFWTYKAWQGTQGFYGAALNAHEARMGGVIGMWRVMTQNMMVLLIPIVAFTALYNYGSPLTERIAPQVTARLAEMPNETMQDQLRTTITLAYLLPAGLLGAFSAVMLAAFLGTNGAYMHSWGSIFIQDVFMPLRKRQETLTTQQHVRLLRWAIAGVGFFAFFYSLFFEQNSAILMYFALTGTVWLGGAGAVIVGGLYWKRGTTAGAYASIITGILTGIVGFTCQRMWKVWVGEEFPINSQWLMLIAMICSTTMYVVFSLSTGRQPFNLDQLLHRGRYAGEDATLEQQSSGGTRRRTLMQLFGIDNDFSQVDKVLYLFVTGWSFVWSGLFILGTILNSALGFTVDTWIPFWRFYVLLAVVLGVVSTVWFSIGGCVDLVDLLKRLKTVTRSSVDDGSVLDHSNSGAADAPSTICDPRNKK